MFKKLLVCLLPLVTLVGCKGGSEPGPEPEPTVDSPLYITNLGGNVTIQYFFEADNPEYAPNLQYSFNRKKWETLSIVQDVATTIATLSKKQTIYFRGDNPDSFSYFFFPDYDDKNSRFYFMLANPSADTKLKIGGNIMSLLSTNDYANKKDIPCNGCFNSLFYEFGRISDDNALITAVEDIDSSELLLPATELKPYAYYNMFRYSTVSKAPLNLPATDSAKGMYESMFAECGSLVTAPVINLNNLSESSCSRMFSSCYTLDISKKGGKVKIFTCPENTSAYDCVYRMFYNTEQVIDDPQPNEVFYYN